MRLRPEQASVLPVAWGHWSLLLFRGIKRMARTSAPRPAWRLAFVCEVKSMQANQTNVTFNTHKAVKALKSSGFNENQAESVVETIDQAVNETVATKADLEVMASKMATKEELGALAAKMATKDDLKNMATKADLEVLTKTVEGIQENIDKNMATKADLAILGADLKVQDAKIDALRETVEGVKEDIKKNMATKVEIGKLETRIMRMMWLQLLAMLGMFVTLVVALP